MIKIIRHGTKAVKECTECGCVFLFEKADVAKNTCGRNEEEYWVVCPDCKTRLYLKPGEVPRE